MQNLTIDSGLWCFWHWEIVAPPAWFEHATHCLEGSCSIPWAKGAFLLVRYYSNNKVYNNIFLKKNQYILRSNFIFLSSVLLFYKCYVRFRLSTSSFLNLETLWLNYLISLPTLATSKKGKYQVVILAFFH